MFERLEERLLLSGNVSLVSQSATSYDGLPADATINDISDDGNLVLFTTSATNVVAGQIDNNFGEDLFLLDRQAGTIRLISHTGDGVTTGNSNSSAVAISGNGLTVVYNSYATNLVAGQADENFTTDVFAYDVATGANVLVSHIGDGVTTGDSESEAVAISADASVIVLNSRASDLLEGQVDFNGEFDVFAYVTATGTNRLVSHIGNNLITGNDASYGDGISGDGTLIVFSSNSTNLVSGIIEQNAGQDVFLYSLDTGTNRLVSHTGDGETTGDGDSYAAAISRDGSIIAFESFATNLAAGQIDENFGVDVFAYNVETTAISLVSHTGDGVTTAEGESFVVAISGNGGVIVYDSYATNLVADQVVGYFGFSVFVYDVASTTNSLVSHAGDGVTTGDDESRAVAISLDGSTILYNSYATDLVNGQFDHYGSQVFTYNVAAGSSQLVSHTGDGLTGGNDSSFAAAISSDGALIAFNSVATDLVAGLHLTLHRQQGYFSAAGVNALITEPQGPSLITSANSDSSLDAGRYSLSADGRYVLFTSLATDLVVGQIDLNNTYDVFLLDRETGVTSLVSHTGDGVTTGDDQSIAVAISSDGSVIVFNSGASNLVAGQIDAFAGSLDVFAYDVTTGTIRLISHAGDGLTTANNQSNAAGISDDGGKILYTSFATNIVAGQDDTASNEDVFLYDMTTETNVLVSHTGDGVTTGNGVSYAVAISGDGSTILFDSFASDLLEHQQDFNSTRDVFLYDISSGTITLVSHTGDGLTTANEGSYSAALSHNGRVVAYHSAATNLVADQFDENDDFDVFAYNSLSGTNQLISHAGDGVTTANSRSTAVHISSDGSLIVYNSRANDLVSGQVDVNIADDVFVYDFSTGANRLVSHTGDGVTAGNHNSTAIAISADNSSVLFLSRSTDLVAGQLDGSGTWDVFVYDVATGANQLVSHTGDGATTGTGNASEAAISDDGSIIAFDSTSSELVSDDLNSSMDVFLWIASTPGDNTAPIARNDAVQTGERTPLSGNLFADNGSGADSDPENDAFVVSAVNGNAVLVGQQITLASGALLTVNSNGSYTYNPNGAFETLNFGQTTTDTFTYTIQDPDGLESTATVTVTIQGANDGFTYTGNTVSIVGTNSDDTVIVDLSTGVITLNGVAHQLSLDVTYVSINALGGHDRLFLLGTAGSEVVRLLPTRGFLDGSSAGITGFAQNFELMHFDGNGGADSVTFIDSAGDDTFTSRPTMARMVGPGFENRAVGVGTVLAISNVGGFDRAVLFDSAGNDTFISTINQSSMSGTGTAVRQFEEVVAIAEYGGFDVANLYDTAGDDLFVGSSVHARMDGTNTTARNFEVLAGYATMGGNDRAVLHGTADNDVLRSESTMTSLIQSNSAVVRAALFEQVVVHGNGGRDVAHLTGSAGADLLVAGQTRTLFSGADYSLVANSFAVVNATAVGAGDVARLQDSPGNDLFTGEGNSARLAGEQAVYTALGFSTVTIQGTTGINVRKLLQPLLYTLIQQGQWV